MSKFNQMYNKERHYHRCERKRFNGKTFRHKLNIFIKEEENAI